MYIENLLTEQLVLTDVCVESKRELFELLAKRAHKHHPCFKHYPHWTTQALVQALEEREAQMTTGIGGGIAFPHARLKDFLDVVVCFAVLKKPLAYGALDDKPVEAVCLILTPQSRPTITLKIMSQISHILGTLNAQKIDIKNLSSAKILHLFRDYNVQLDTPVTAAELMQPLPFIIREETPLREVTQMMSKFNTHCTAIQNDQGELVGEINCDLLFRFGMPEFFSQLKSVSFIAEFDPFEKYFVEESSSVAKDIMSSHFCALPKESPLLEVVFAIAIRRHSKVFVVDGGKLIGEIDKSAVLNRIINF